MNKNYINPIILCLLLMCCYIKVNSQALLTETDINNKTINTAKEIGVIPGSYSVSLSGAANYVIPITVPDAVNGMQPSISVSYSSQSSNGLLGYGWSLNALSAITYDNLDFYHDDQAKPSSINEGRPFILDGSRLILTSGTQGATNSEYRTEAESFSKITVQGTSGCSSCPTWFKIETKSGLTLEYGNSTDSKMMNAANDKTIAWYLSKIKDNYDNYIEYKYTIINGELLLDKIIYNQGGTGTTIAATYKNEIQFTYDNRADNNQYFANDDLGNITTLYTKNKLTAVKVYAEGVFVRKYGFVYGSDGLYTYLNEVKLFADDAGTKEINSTIFKYGQTEISPTSANYNYMNGSTADIISLDFNGNGFDDIFIAYYTKDTKGKKYTSYKVYENNKTGGFTLAKTATFPTTYSSKTLYMNFHIADLDGDGRKEIIAENRTNLFSTSFKINGYYTIEKQNNYNLTSYTNITAGTIIAPYYFIVEDFDGDGKDDIIHSIVQSGNNVSFLSQPGNNVYNIQIGSYDIYSNVYLYDGEDLAYITLKADTLFTAFFDGDTKADIIYRLDNGNEYVFTINTHFYNNNMHYSGAFVFANNNLLANKFNYFGDFNGDGKSDNLRYDGGWKIVYSTGKNISTSNFTFTEAVSTSNLETGIESIKVADYNHDGKADIMHYYNDGSTPKYAVYYSSGIQFLRKEYTAPHSFSHKPALVGDFNGDGNADVIDTILNNTANFYIVQFNPKSKERLLEKVKDGYENTVVFNYKLFTEGGAFYSYTNSNSYPLKTIAPKTFGVEQVTVPDGSGNISSTYNLNYNYENANYHSLKGFLGFKKVVSKNSLTNIKQESTFDILTTTPSNDLYLQVSTESKTYLDASPIEMISKTNGFEYDLTQYGNKHFWLKTTEATTEQYIDGTLFATLVNTKAFDANGNLTSESVNNNSGLETTTTTVSDFSSEGTWLPSNPKYITTTTNYNGDSYTEQTKLTYNAKGQTYTGIAFNNTVGSSADKSITTTYDYETTNGLTTKITVDPSDETARFTEYEYQDNKRTLKKTKNSLGDVSTNINTYDPRWNAPLSTTDFYTNYTTSYTYDDFGKLKTTTQQPNNVSSSIDYTWAIDATNHQIYKVESTIPNAPDSKTYYNRLGSIVKTETENQAGNWVSTTTNYNAFGLQANTIVPNANGGTISTTYLYDDYQRPYNIYNSISTNTYSYGISGGLYSITTSATGFANKTYFKEATGKLKKVTDGGGDIVYTYYGNGQIKDITAASATTSMEYDARGNQTKLTEANAGESQYQYNGFGELKEQTDNKGNKYILSYDVLGRLTQRLLDPAGTTNPNETTIYDYITSGNGLRQLYQVKLNGTVQETYGYDTWHRPVSFTETIDGTSYTTTLTYNNADNSIKDITYPQNIKIEYGYNNGFLNQIKHGTTILYQTNSGTGSTNTYSQVKNYTLGNGKSSTIAYNDLGMPTHFTTTGIQNLEMSYNLANGNLNYRQDNTTNQREDFEYNTYLDALSQITTDNDITTSFNTPTLYNIGYNNNGNIDNKYLAGTEYSYDANKVHAVLKTQADCDETGATGIQNITYTPYNQPKQISQGNFELTYSYNSNYNRNKSILKESGTTTATRYYIGNYEKLIQNGTTQHLYYIQSPVGLCAIIKKQGTTTNYFYTYTDHLGSIVSITNNTGTVVTEQSFDAWGKQRNPNNWDDYNQSNFTIPANTTNYYWLTRGYTGHEMLPQFNLINMNGRMYDPIVGRMLSPDNYVQDATNSQNYNRYSYVLNNPLKYTDPSGMLYYDATKIVQMREDLLENSQALSGGGGGGSSMGKYNGGSIFSQISSLYGTLAAMNAYSNGTINAIQTEMLRNMTTVTTYNITRTYGSGTQSAGLYGYKGGENVPNGDVITNINIRTHSQLGMVDISAYFGTPQNFFNNTMVADGGGDWRPFFNLSVKGTAGGQVKFNANFFNAKLGFDINLLSVDVFSLDIGYNNNFNININSMFNKLNNKPVGLSRVIGINIPTVGIKLKQTGHTLNNNLQWNKPIGEYNLFSFKTKYFGNGKVISEREVTTDKVKRIFLDIGINQAFLFGYEIKFKFGIIKK